MKMKPFFAKTICLSLILAGTSCFAQQKSDAILMTIANSKITVGEFENVYNKNNIKDSKNDTKSLQDYIELFTNFKLKVKEAEELGLDTASSFVNELAGYRKQLAQPYLTDKEVNEKLIKESYDRLNWDVKASHILVMLAENALPKDTLEAYNKIIKIRTRILKGEDFSKVAMEKGVSDDPSAKDNGGDLGYFTAFQMVYPFETSAYNTKVTEISMPVRTKYGYHIIKVIDKRKAMGEILVGHIMVKAANGVSMADSLNAKAKIDELYQKIKKGDTFSELAMQFSDDKGSGKKGGELPWFGTNKMPIEFEKAAFALGKNGDISEPIRTKFGWHIIKRIDKKEIQPFDNMKAELKTKITKDSRSQIGRESLIAKTKIEYKFKENLKLRDEFYKLIDSTYFEGKWSVEKAKALTKPMFNLLDKTYSQIEFANFLDNHQSKRAKMNIPMLVNLLYAQFVSESCVAFEENKLDKKYPEFSALMKEYRDGILLFELTDRKVWSKAVKDSIGLKEYYDAHKNNYLWEERVDASIFSCANEKIAQKTKELLKKNKSEKDILSEINKDSQLNLQVDTRIFQKKENELVDNNWKMGTSENKKSEKNVEFVQVNKILVSQPKAFTEAKGLITADYQSFLEKEWIESLKKKYPVEIDKKVMATIQ